MSILNVSEAAKILTLLNDMRIYVFPKASETFQSPLGILSTEGMFFQESKVILEAILLIGKKRRLKIQLEHW